MTYDETCLNSGINIIDWITCINVWFDGQFTTLLLVEFFLIILIATSKVDFKVSMVVASSVTMFTSLIFSALGWCTWEIIAIPVVIWLGSLVVMVWVD